MGSVVVSEAGVSEGGLADSAATRPFAGGAVGHFATVWPLFLQNRHRLFSQHRHRSSLFNLPLALRCCSLGQSDGVGRKMVCC